MEAELLLFRRCVGDDALDFERRLKSDFVWHRHHMDLHCSCCWQLALNDVGLQLTMLPHCTLPDHLHPAKSCCPLELRRWQLAAQSEHILRTHTCTCTSSRGNSEEKVYSRSFGMITLLLNITFFEVGHRPQCRHARAHNHRSVRDGPCQPRSRRDVRQCGQTNTARIGRFRFSTSVRVLAVRLVDDDTMFSKPEDLKLRCRDETN
mmetsp:Transcript_70287/g.211369  ORF Transcript_70287/g.211369 Transcript_70287/m.211369 type:complete len:206 (+) Transcript_70287:1601-2218(+)